MLKNRNPHIAFALIAASLFLGACGSSKATADSTIAVTDSTLAGTVSDSTTATPATGDTTTPATATEPASSVADATVAASSPAADTTAATTAGSTDTSAVAAMTPFGSACSTVSAEGSGSFVGMAAEPAATAASNNPDLSTLVAAVKAAGLVDTLNGTGPFTILAPNNAAFAKIPAATMDTVMADPKGALSSILTLHVIPGKALSAADLLSAKSAVSVQGESVMVTGSGQDITVNGTAKVVCGDIKIANGIVHIIDTVLMPK
jgi:uncharacterized surface protein with fasciclin (FAS1) repeats